MKHQNKLFWLILLLAIFRVLPSEDKIIAIDQIDIGKLDELEFKDLVKTEGMVKFEKLPIEKIILLLGNTFDFEYEDFLIQNYYKSLTLDFSWKGEVSKIKDPDFKLKLSKLWENLESFKLKYRKIYVVHDIREKAIAYLCENKFKLKNQEEVFACLQPRELKLFKESGEDKIIKKDYRSAYKEYYQNKREAFNFKHDLLLQAELYRKEFSVSEILNLMRKSEYYLNYSNLKLLNKIISKKELENSYEELFLVLDLWNKNHSFELLLSGNDFVNGQLFQILEVAFGIMLKKNDPLKLKELEKKLGSKLYQNIFIEKIELSKIPEFNFEKEFKLLNGKE